MSTQNNNANVVIREVVTTEAEVFINGVSKGSRKINGTPTLKEFVKGLASEFGVKSFNVSLDDVAITPSNQHLADAPLTTGSKVEIKTKESRAAEGEAMQEPATEATATEEAAPADSEEEAHEEAPAKE